MLYHSGHQPCLLRTSPPTSSSLKDATTSLVSCVNFTTEGVDEFMSSTMNIDSQDLISKMEGFAVQGMKGAAKNHQKQCSAVRSAIRHEIGKRLVEITKDEDAKMHWTNYFRNVIQCYQVIIEGKEAGTVSRHIWRVKPSQKTYKSVETVDTDDQDEEPTEETSANNIDTDDASANTNINTDDTGADTDTNINGNTDANLGALNNVNNATNRTTLAANELMDPDIMLANLDLKIHGTQRQVLKLHQRYWFQGLDRDEVGGTFLRYEGGRPRDEVVVASSREQGWWWHPRETRLVVASLRDEAGGGILKRWGGVVVAKSVEGVVDAYGGVVDSDGGGEGQGAWEQYLADFGRWADSAELLTGSVHKIAGVLEYLGQYITLVLSISTTKPNNKLWSDPPVVLHLGNFYPINMSTTTISHIPRYQLRQTRARKATAEKTNTFSTKEAGPLRTNISALGDDQPHATSPAYSAGKSARSYSDVLMA
ncbi:hypothetical protein DFJ58DRAFT_847952, partial [Suillus subalutaceus]|uniref:uncharacterized protein n=1 Tax=Suillus subalutaceus TaxID=48586 RepID=UPI001B880100